MKTILKRVLGWFIIIHLIPLICLAHWRFNSLEYNTYYWYMAIEFGYFIEIAALILVGLTWGLLGLLTYLIE